MPDRNVRAALSLVGASILACLALPADGAELNVGGLVFGDVYYVPSEHRPSDDGAAGVVLRRGYLTLDTELTERWDARLRFEVNQSGGYETYDFKSKAKDLWVRFKAGTDAEQTIVAGLAPTPGFSFIESFWGMRYLARTPTDLQGVPSRALGVAVEGPLAGARLSYRLMVGSGEEFGAAPESGEQLMAALNWRFAPGWVTDFFAEYERSSDAGDQYAVQAFTGYQTDNLRLGLQYASYDQGADPRLELASAFVVKDLAPKYAFIARVDRLMEPSPKGNAISYLPFDPSARASMFIGAFEWRPREWLRVTPNLVLTVYDRNDEGVRPEPDVHLRLTLFASLE